MNMQKYGTFMFVKTLSPQGFARWLYTCIWPKYSNISATAWPIKAKLHGRGTKAFQGNLTKMAAITISCKAFKMFFRTSRPMILKLGIKHLQSLNMA